MVTVTSILFSSVIVLITITVFITDGVVCEEYLSENSNTISKVSQHFQAFLECLEMVKHVPDNWTEADTFCGPTFDGIGCWDATLADTVMRISCPNYVSSKTENHAVRRCLTNGTWEMNHITGKDSGDYSQCEFNGSVHPIDESQLNSLLELMKKLETSPYANIHTTLEFNRCIDDVLTQPRITGDQLYCPRTFDGWGCWNDTNAGEIAYIPCPNFIQGFSSEKYAHKECAENGQWYVNDLSNRTWSNYTQCVDQEDLEFRQTINTVYICGYSISLFALTISLVIFFSFTALSVQRRIKIHKNLFGSFIINNMMWIIWYTTVVNKSEVLLLNGYYCITLHVLVHYFMVSNYLWMFCEGLYLHTLLVVAFVSESKILKWFYILGWGVPIPLTAMYTILRSQSEDPKDSGFCWIDESAYMWLLSGPVGVSFLLNLFFLINIVRVLVTKMRAVNSPDTHQTRKAVRATLILIPLLGLQFALTPFRPEPKSAGETIYEIVSAIVISLQGLCVAMIFCLFNGEVICAIRTLITQQMLMRSKHPYKFRSRSLQSTIV